MIGLVGVMLIDMAYTLTFQAGISTENSQQQSHGEASAV